MSNNRIRPGRVVAVFTASDARVMAEAAASHETHPAHLATVIDLHTRERVA